MNYFCGIHGLKSLTFAQAVSHNTEHGCFICAEVTPAARIEPKEVACSIFIKCPVEEGPRHRSDYHPLREDEIWGGADDGQENK